ncbi:MAG TPA: family 78 glycoside hydrolase catalytic domain, partial [Puia sp.]|nr:family 78 glycoside hydrolase catalytic domain [Puia sp.]
MKRFFIIALVLWAQTAFSQEIKLIDLRCEYRTNPLGIGTATPRLSWELHSSHRGVVQSAFRILVSEDTVSLRRYQGIVWDSRKQTSNVSIGVAYAGPALTPGHTYYWRVMVWDEHRNDSSHWSAIASFGTGLFSEADWKKAEWIGYEALPDSSLLLPAPAVKGVRKRGPFRDTLPLFRREFTIDKPVLRATAFISGLGHFELSVNGSKTGDHFLDPGWVRYDKKALYVALDLTSQLREGVNAVGVMLGNGFYYIPRERYHKLLTAYGYPKLIARIVLEYRDGSREDIVTDGSWKTAPGPIVFSSIYGGEDYDARREQAGWDSPHFDDRGWRAAVAVRGPAVLEAQGEEPLKVFENFSARKIFHVRLAAGRGPGTAGGATGWVYDLGQNSSGIARISVTGSRGAIVRIVPAELLGKDSTANQKATGKPYYWEYTLKGEGTESWQPRFTYYGFRYLQVEGAVPEGEPNPDHLPVVTGLLGLHTRNAMEKVGNFTCSNLLFRRIDTLIDWAIQSNLASVFTDCPHREKLGWLEEAHLMGNSMRYTYDIASLYRKIIGDMEDAQTADGLIPEIAPEFTVFGEPFRDSPEWGSSSILVPWYLYQWYGDKTMLAEAWPMMKKYIHYLGERAQDHLLYEGLGDWYDIGPARPGVSQLTPKGVTASTIYYYDLGIMTKVARLLGENGEEYSREAERVGEAFNKKFFDPATGQVASGSQAANAMALFTGIVPKRYRDTVMANIVRDLRRRNNSLTAGDIGFRYLLKTLDLGGRPDLIYDMNSRTDVPGYGYQLAKGATALTESWQAYPSVSNDHLMLGHIMEWFYAGLAGIVSPDDSGTRGDAPIHSTIRPEPVGDIQWVQADYHSPYGLISSHWKRSGSIFDLEVSIPANTTATVYLPVSAGAVITEGWKRIALRPDVHLVRHDSGWAVFEIGSGNYNFRSVTGNAVSEKKMEAVYEKVKTPYKYGLIKTLPDKSKKLDCPTIFRKGESWYMSYIIFDGRGYETWLAKSADLLHWKTLGRILSFSDTTGVDKDRWDANQKAGYVGLADLTWGGSYQLQKYKGKYWMSYFGGNTRGYEAGVLSEGMAFTDKDPGIAHEWQRLDHPILSPKDSHVSWWDDHTMYKTNLIWDKRRITGHPFLLYYNANGDSLDKRRGAERIGMAYSDDMIHWSRYGHDPVLDHLTGITGDPYIQKIGDLYVMFYFGAFWHGTHGAFNRFACSYDLVHWTDWTGPDLIESSEPYDEVFAHKSCVVNYKGTVYHYYCAVDKKGNRGIALATSTNKGRSSLNFPGEAAVKNSRVNFDAGWQFHLGEDTSHAVWRTLDLPHDWSIEGKFDPHNPTGQGEAGLPAGIGWYRKVFRRPAGDRIYIDFDGIYRNSEVWVNG